MQKRKTKKGKIMQIVIDIPEEIIKDAKESPNYYPSYLFGTIWKSIGNGTPIPDNATNGDVIKTIFSEIEIIDIRTIIDCPEEGTVYFECFEGDNIHSLDLSWWNTPYQKGGKVE